MGVEAFAVFFIAVSLTEVVDLVAMVDLVAFFILNLVVFVF